MRQESSRDWTDRTGRLAIAGLLLVVVVIAATLPLLTRQAPSVEETRPAVATAPVALSSPQPTPQPVVAQPTPPPAPDGVYREALVGRPATLNPLLANSDVERDIASLLFAGLTRADGRGGVQGDLAERWTIGDDGKTYTFELRQNARWHDGRPVTPADVVFTVRLMQDPDFPGSGALTALWRAVQARVVGERGVSFTLNEPYSPFLTQTNFPVLPAHLLRGVFPGDLPTHEFSVQPVGAGPFKLARAYEAADVSLLLDRHENYYAGQPSLRQIVLRYYPSYDEALADLKAGVVDGLGGVPSARLGEARDDQALRLHSASLNGYMTLLLNQRRPLFQQREVRQALALAINRGALVQEALGGAAMPGASPIPYSSWAYDPAPVTGTIHDARALLETAGWYVRGADGVRERDGKRLTFNLLTTDSGERLEVARVLSQQLRALGVQVTVVTVPSVDLIPRHLASHDFDAALFGWITPADEPDPYAQWHSSQAERGYNFAGWNLSRADEALEQARLATDRDTRRGHYREFQRLFASEAPSIVLYYPQYTYVTTTRLQGVDLAPLSRPADRFRGVHAWRITAVEAVG